MVARLRDGGRVDDGQEHAEPARSWPGGVDEASGQEGRRALDTARGSSGGLSGRTRAPPVPRRPARQAGTVVGRPDAGLPTDAPFPTGPSIGCIRCRRGCGDAHGEQVTILAIRRPRLNEACTAFGNVFVPGHIGAARAPDPTRPRGTECRTSENTGLRRQRCRGYRGGSLHGKPVSRNYDHLARAGRARLRPPSIHRDTNDNAAHHVADIDVGERGASCTVSAGVNLSVT